MTAAATVAMVSGLSAPAAQAAPSPISDDTASVHGTVYATMQQGNTIYLGGEFDFVGRRSGAGQVVDLAGGLVASAGLRIVGQVNTAVPDGIGGWFIGGSFTQVRGTTRLGLARITKAGLLSSFRVDVTGTVNALAYSGGTLYVGGSFTSIGGQPRSNLAAVTASNGAVTSWSPSTDGEVKALKLSSSGSSLYVGGAFSTVSGVARSDLAELSTTNGVPTTWNPGVTGQVRAIETSGATVYVGGDFSAAGGAGRTDLAAVDSATGAATSWSPSTDGAVNAIAVTDGGNQVVVGGSFGTVSGQPQANLARISSGGLLFTLQPETNGEVFDLEPTPAGDVQVVGAFTSLGGVSRLRAGALTSSGGVTAWDPSTDATVRATSVSTYQGASQSLLGGSFLFANGAPRSNIAALDATTGDVIRGFTPDTDAIVKAFALSPDASTLFIGGGFTTVNGASRARLAAIDAATGALRSWVCNAGSTVHALTASGTSLYVGGSFFSIGGQPQARLARVSTANGAVDTTFTPVLDGRVRALVLTNDASQLFAVGEFKTVSGVARPGAASILTGTGATGAFAPSLGGLGIAADLSPDESRFYFSTSTNRLYAYNLNGATSPSWTFRTDGDVQAIAAEGDEVYAGGHFVALPVENVTKPHLVSINDATGITNAWSPAVNGSFGVWTITTTPTSMLIGGDFLKAGTRQQPGFARFLGTP